MRIAFLALSGTAFDQLDQRRPAADQQVELAAQVVDRAEPRHAFAACQEFMRGLRPAQQQQPDQGDLGLGQREALRQLVLVALDPRGEHLAHQALLLQQSERPPISSGSSAITGSRAVFWLAAACSPFSVIG